MSSLTHRISEDFYFDFPDLLIDASTEESLELCDECESEFIVKQLKTCNSCDRLLCSECFLSDFDTVCYDCYALKE